MLDVVTGTLKVPFGCPYAPFLAFQPHHLFQSPVVNNYDVCDVQSGAGGEASTSASASASDPDNVTSSTASAAAVANIEDPYASLNDDPCGGTSLTTPRGQYRRTLELTIQG